MSVPVPVIGARSQSVATSSGNAGYGARSAHICILPKTFNEVRVRNGLAEFNGELTSK